MDLKKYQVYIHMPTNIKQTATLDKLYKMDDWCDQHCKHEWKRLFRGRYEFVDSRDALMFKLKWHG